MTTLSNEQLKKLYKSSGLYHIAFNSNGRDFFPETIQDLLDWRDKSLASQLQAILKEVREGAVDVYWDEHNGELVQAVPLSHLDALEKKYKVGE